MTDEEKKKRFSCRRGIRRIADGCAETIVAIVLHIDRLVRRFPWFCITLVVVASVVATLSIKADCKYKQLSAEQQRDSLFLQLENVRMSGGL